MLPHILAKIPNFNGVIPEPDMINNEGKKYLVAYSPFMKGVESSYWGFKWIKYKDTVELTNMEYEDMLSKFF